MAKFQEDMEQYYRNTREVLQEYERRVTRTLAENHRSTGGEVKELCIGKAVGDYRRSIRQVLEWYSRNSVGAQEQE